jgi:hypothetical protein
VGVAAAPWAGELELELAVDVRVDEADEADDDDEEDDEPAVDGVAFAELLVAVELGAADELSGVEVAGAVPVGADGVVVSDDDEAFVSSPRVVFPDEEEFPTSADTGFCPISSIPVTIAIATTNTETA